MTGKAAGLGFEERIRSLGLVHSNAVVVWPIKVAMVSFDGTLLARVRGGGVGAIEKFEQGRVRRLGVVLFDDL